MSKIRRQNLKFCMSIQFLGVINEVLHAAGARPLVDGVLKYFEHKWAFFYEASPQNLHYFITEELASKAKTLVIFVKNEKKSSSYHLVVSGHQVFEVVDVVLGLNFLVADQDVNCKRCYVLAILSRKFQTIVKLIGLL